MCQTLEVFNPLTHNPLGVFNRNQVTFEGIVDFREGASRVQRKPILGLPLRQAFTMMYQSEGHSHNLPLPPSEFLTN